jgi:endoglycosylceramidase
VARGPFSPVLSLMICSLVLAAASAASATPALRVDGRHFRDASGGVVILRGVNVAGNSKVPPFRPVTGPSFFDPLPGWGMNAVRLLFNWEAYEPAPGVYDASYLDYYASAVDAAASRGLHVIVDFHQDAFSRVLVGGCGDGIPPWAVPPWVARRTPDNGPACAIWGAQMIWDVGMHLAWSSFHRDQIGARTRYLAMVGRVAARLASHPGVIGYDMMNEPWGDEPTDLYRMYEDAAVAIRAHHPEAILFVSPHALISAGGKSGLRRPSFGNFVFSPHFYDGSVIVLKAWPGGDLAGPYGNMRSVAAAWGVPLFVGEFGAAAQTLNVEAYVRTNYERLDETLASGAQWVYTPGWTEERKDGWNDENLSIATPAGVPRANFTPRPYPRRIAGAPTSFRADLAARTIDLYWQHDPATGSTELYVPAQAVFGQPTFTVTAYGEQISCSAGSDLVRCSSPLAGPKRVQITP